MSPDGSSDGRIRQVLATLADADRRRMFAQLVLADGGIDADVLSNKERRQLSALERAGLATVDGSVARASDGFTPLLSKKHAATGIERFLREGRIVTWPSKPADREALMQWALEQAIPASQRLDERTITERLGMVWDDPATLRRDLVDSGILQRAADGSAYWR